MVKVTMKDGKTYEGDLWTWRPVQGWFALLDDHAPERIWLRDVSQAVNKNVWRTVKGPEDVDMLERAKKEGWAGG